MFNFIINKLNKITPISQKTKLDEMAWKNRTPFDALKFQSGVAEVDVKALMKKN